MIRCLVLVALAIAPLAHATAAHRYLVSVGDSLDRLDVRACFDGAPPEALIAGTDGARAYLERIRGPGGASVPLPASDRIALAGIAADGCIDYRVRLQAVRAGAQTGGPESRWIGRDLLTSIGDWLWQPPGDVELEVQFRTPAGIAVSAPWTRIDEGRYSTGATPADWPGVVAFGRFQEKRIEVPGAVLRLAMLDNPPPGQQAWIENWVAQAARNTASLTGRFPVASLQVIVAPTRGSGPVPWAYVARGGGPAVHLFINPALPPETFLSDWSATHEMAHLFLPYVFTRDVWLAEGVPTYLQNVLMARAGAISEAEAWNRMIVGFQRGEKVGVGLSLARASERVGYAGLYRRVYWAGAALMLEADLEVRDRTGGAQSLATALQSLAQCCLQSARRWSAAELMEALDRATGTTVFGDIPRSRLEDDAFPDFKRTLVRTGVTVSGGEVRLDASAPWAGWRRALMQASSPVP